jgi:phosphatidylglycerol:prolipoprotein diacylglycerol transferase
MFPVLQLGPVAIPVSPLALLIGVWVALELAEREAARLNLSPDAVYRLAVVGLAAGLLGARLAYVARFWNAYALDLWGVFSLNAAALAPADGALIGVTAALVYGARRQLPLRVTLDALAPGLAAMAVAVAVAHVSSGDAFGAAARLPWSVFLWDEYRHPSQLYELIAALGVLGIVWRVRAYAPYSGFNFLLVAALSAATRLFLEAFRGDSLLLGGGWRAAQLWGLLIVVACLVAARYWGREKGPAAQPIP